MEIKFELLDNVPFVIEKVRMSVYRKGGYIYPRVEDFPLDIYDLTSRAGYELFDHPAVGRDLQLGLLLVLRFDQVRDERNNEIPYKKFIDPYIKTFVNEQMQNFIRFCDGTNMIPTAQLCPLAALKDHYEALRQKWEKFLDERSNLYKMTYEILENITRELALRWFQEHKNEYAIAPLEHSYGNNFSKAVAPFGWWAIIPPAKGATYAQIIYYIQELITAYGENVVAEAVDEIQKFIDSL